MFQAPFNNVVVTIDGKYIQNLSTALKMAAINPGSQINPADYANILGTVVSLPKCVTNDKGYKGFSTKDIKVGDLIIMRYDVVWQFEEIEEGKAKFKNMVMYKGMDYWLAHISKIFAVIRDEKIRMINGYCMLENISKPMNIILPQSMKRITNSATATLTHIRDNREGFKRIDAEAGDVVFYNPNHIQEYKIRGKIFGILTQEQIFGRKTAIYEGFQNVSGL